MLNQAAGPIAVLPLFIPNLPFSHWFSNGKHNLLMQISGPMGPMMIGVLVSAQVVFIKADI